MKKVTSVKCSGLQYHRFSLGKSREPEIHLRVNQSFVVQIPELHLTSKFKRKCVLNKIIAERQRE